MSSPVTHVLQITHWAQSSMRGGEGAWRASFNACEDSAHREGSWKSLQLKVLWAKEASYLLHIIDSVKHLLKQKGTKHSNHP